MQILGIVALIVLIALFVAFIRQSTNIYSKVSLMSALVVSLGLIASACGVLNPVPRWLALTIFMILALALLAMVLFAIVGAVTGKTVSNSRAVPAFVWNGVIPIVVAMILLFVIGIFIYLLSVVGAAFHG